jgi:hypothetical protein
MGPSMYLLDFRRMTVEEIADPKPPPGIHDGTSPGAYAGGTGITLAAMGSPPRRDDRGHPGAREAGIDLDLDPPAQRPTSRCPSPEALRPGPELARTLAARQAWTDLEPVMLVLIEQGGVQFETAMSWLTEPDEALDGHSPAAWIAAGRNPATVEPLARRAAARLAR